MVESKIDNQALPYASRKSPRRASLSLLLSLAGLGLCLLLVAFERIVGTPTGESPLKVPSGLILCSALLCAGGGTLIGLSVLLPGNASERLEFALTDTLIGLSTAICLSYTI